MKQLVLTDVDGKPVEIGGRSDPGYEDRLVEALTKAISRKRKPFTGALSQPIHAPHDVELAVFVPGAKPEDWEAVEQGSNQIIADQQDAKLALLAARYRLKPPATADEWKQLCIRLATETVPGFQIKRTLKKPRRGRQPKQFTVGGAPLLDAVNAHLAKGGTITDAIRKLLKDEEPWCSAKPSVKSLQAQYSKAKKDQARHEADKAHAIESSMNAMIRKALKATAKATR